MEDEEAAGSALDEAGTIVPAGTKPEDMTIVVGKAVKIRGTGAY